jgi:hypothetical protein
MDNKNLNNTGFIPSHGGYKNLITYQKLFMMAPFILQKDFLVNMIAL